jgi:hypothetical protein
MAENKSIKELQDEILKLQGELKEERSEKDDLEKLVYESGRSSQFLSDTSEEKATGKFITIEKCTNPWVKKKSEQIWEEEKVPTFFFTIDLPPGAGSELSTNGLQFYHGETYELSYYTLVDIKSRIARCWDHEKSIHGENENVYRKKTNTAFISAEARNRGAH